MKKTPLNDCHREAGAKLVDFAGWEMPVQYQGLMEEHVAVRTRAGIFDVSHMGEIEVSGPGALALLQKVTSNDVSRLAAGQAHYTALMTPAGAFVDDILVHRMEDGRYLLCVNAANTAKDFEWIRSQSGPSAAVADRSADFAQIALQGPAAAAILTQVAGPAAASLRRYRFLEQEVRGAPAIVARTGYTGEDGFEIYCPPGAAAELWRALLAAGKPEGLVPVGLGARDTLRLEAKMALYGNDIDETTSVLEADLGWIVSFEKGDFIGRDVLARQRDEGVTRRLVGFELLDRGIPRHGYPIVVAGRESGAVTSGTFAPFLKRNIGLAYLPAGHDRTGSRFEVVIRGKGVPAEVVPTPFYRKK
jgi:aminomethyltransferase